MRPPLFLTTRLSLRSTDFRGAGHTISDSTRALGENSASGSATGSHLFVPMLAGESRIGNDPTIAYSGESRNYEVQGTSFVQRALVLLRG